MKKVLLWTVAALAATFASIASGDPLPVDKRIVLVVDEWKAVRNLPVVVAERLGYLKADGMDVTVMNVRDDVWHGDMLVDGRVDAVMAYWHHNAVNQSIGRDTQAIVTLGVTPGAKVLVANHARDKYRTLADLKGSHFIAGGAGSSKTTLANALVLAGGHKLSDYTRLGTDGKDLNVAALRDGRADFVVAPTPDASFYEAQGVATVFADLTTPEGTKKAFGVPFPSSTVFMATARMKERPDIARHLAKAFTRALHFINTHSPEQIAAVVPEAVSGKDREKYMKAMKEALPMFATNGLMPADGVAHELRVLAEFDPKFKPVDVKRTYTNAFVEEALKAAP
ncbi:ABC transporter substrate-binding protein [Variovorax sp. LjRoot84]|uniref:ABC transporter substrate-binding protein n=1 Tax=Variovorax sp. LjRoot84 TaxID=3342340 RepID=UPI003ECC54A6